MGAPGNSAKLGTTFTNIQTNLQCIKGTTPFPLRTLHDWWLKNWLNWAWLRQSRLSRRGHCPMSLCSIFTASVRTMEVECSGGGVLIFSYIILIHQLDNFGGLRWAEAAWYEWVHWLPLWRPADSVQTGFARSKLNRGSLMRVSSLVSANSCSVISDKLSDN